MTISSSNSLYSISLHCFKSSECVLHNRYQCVSIVRCSWCEWRTIECDYLHGCRSGRDRFLKCIICFSVCIEWFDNFFMVHEVRWIVNKLQSPRGKGVKRMFPFKLFTSFPFISGLLFIWDKSVFIGCLYLFNRFNYLSQECSFVC